MSISCRTMEKGQIYICEDCGLEIEVRKKCENVEESGTCEECSFVCCGEEMTLKE